MSSHQYTTTHYQEISDRDWYLECLAHMIRDRWVTGNVDVEDLVDSLPYVSVVDRWLIACGVRSLLLAEKRVRWEGDQLVRLPSDNVYIGARLLEHAVLSACPGDTLPELPRLELPACLAGKASIESYARFVDTLTLAQRGPRVLSDTDYHVTRFLLAWPEYQSVPREARALALFGLRSGFLRVMSRHDKDFFVIRNALWCPQPGLRRAITDQPPAIGLVSRIYVPCGLLDHQRRALGSFAIACDRHRDDLFGATISYAVDKGAIVYGSDIAALANDDSVDAWGTQSHRAAAYLLAGELRLSLSSRNNYYLDVARTEDEVWRDYANARERIESLEQCIRRQDRKLESAQRRMVAARRALGIADSGAPKVAMIDAVRAAVKSRDSANPVVSGLQKRVGELEAQLVRVTELADRETFLPALPGASKYPRDRLLSLLGQAGFVVSPSDESVRVNLSASKLIAVTREAPIGIVPRAFETLAWKGVVNGRFCDVYFFGADVGVNSTTFERLYSGECFRVVTGTIELKPSTYSQFYNREQIAQAPEDLLPAARSPHGYKLVPSHAVLPHQPRFWLDPSAMLSSWATRDLIDRWNREGAAVDRQLHLRPNTARSSWAIIENVPPPPAPAAPAPAPTPIVTPPPAPPAAAQAPAPSPTQAPKPATFRW